MTNFVKSIQPFSILAASVGVASATINEIDTTKSIIIFNGITTNSNTTNYNRPNFRCYFTNSTTITITKDGGSADSHTVNGVVIEFHDEALLSPVQHGTIVLSAGQLTNSAIITEVNLDKAALFYLGKGFGGTANGLGNNNCMCTRLASSTTVISEREGSNNTIVIGFCIAEFSPALIKSVQHRYLTLPATEAVTTDSILSVNPDNTLLCVGENSQSIVSPNAQDIFTGVRLLNATTTELVRGSTVSSTRKIAYDIIEFLPGILKQPIQRGIGILNNDNYISQSFSPVDSNRAFVSLSGYKVGGTGSNIVRQFMPKITLSGNSVASTVNTAGSVFAIPATYWQVIEFAPAVTLAKAQVTCQATNSINLTELAEYQIQLAETSQHQCSVMEEIND